VQMSVEERLAALEAKTARIAAKLAALSLASLSVDTAIDTYSEEDLSAESRERVTDYIAQHLQELVDHKTFEQAPKALILKLLARPQLPILEVALFDAVSRWVTRHSVGEDSKDAALALWKELSPLINFERMGTRALATKVAPMGILSPESLIALMTKAVSVDHKALELGPQAPGWSNSAIEVTDLKLTLRGGQWASVTPPPLGGEEFTIALFVRPTVVDSSFHGFMGKQAASRSPSLWVSPGGGLHYDSYHGGTRYSGDLPGYFTVNRWHHVIWIKTKSEFILYRDGVEFGRARAPPMCTMMAGYDIGRVDNHFIGDLADIRTWAQALPIKTILDGAAMRIKLSE